MVKRSGLYLWIYLTLPLMAFGILYLLRILQIAQTETAQMTPFGRYTSEQIIAHSLPLIDQLGLRNNALSFNTSHFEVKRDSIRQQRLWEVDCTDRSGNYCANLIWDADTGDLRSMGRHVKPATKDLKPLARDFRLRLAQHWLHTLAPDSADFPLLTPVVDEFEEVEQFTWQINNTQESFSLDKFTGTLVMFHHCILTKSH